jgi:hypothetical protein
LTGKEAFSCIEFLHFFILFQILDIDRILHEQQLGLEWIGPDLSLLHHEDLASYRSAMQVIADVCPETGKVKTGGVQPKY